MSFQGGNGGAMAAVNAPELEKNYNSMKPVAEQTGEDARVAHVRLLHEAGHASLLRLPVGEVGAGCTASAGW